jgi:hypothetical protein
MALDLGELYATVHLRGGEKFRGDIQSSKRELQGLDRQAGDSSGRMGGMLEGLAGALGKLGSGLLPVAKGLAAFGSAVPLVAGVVAALADIAPAAAVGATAILSVGFAAAALKIGMSGVSDAVSAAFDPSQPEAYAAALKKLSPNAREFVSVLHEMAPQLRGIKNAIQDDLFKNLGASLRTTATAVLPILYGGLHTAAQALNGMAFNALGAARSLAKDGTLGTAISGATGGLKSLATVPADIIRAFVQVAAAAAPTFKRLTAAAGAASTSISQKISAAFKSGRMEGAINVAVSLLKDLGSVAKNVFTVVRNVFSATQATGGGFIGTLKTISAELAKVSGNPAVQAGLRALFTTMSDLAKTAAPLLGQVLIGLAPVLTALGPPIQQVIAQLGPALQPVIAALGPALVAIAKSFGTVLIAVAPLLPILGNLIAGVLVPLTPLLQFLAPAITGIVAALRIWTAVQTVLNVVLSANPVGLVVLAIGALVAGVIYAYKHSETFRNGVNLLWGEVKNLWSGLQPLITAVGDLGSKVGDYLVPKLRDLGGAFVSAKDHANVDFAPAMDGAKAAAGRLADYLNTDGKRSIQGFGSAVSQAGTDIVASTRSWTSRTAPVLYQWGVSVGRALDRMADSVNASIFSLGRTVTSEFTSIWRRLPALISSSIPSFKSAGRAVMNGLVAGLEIVAPELVYLGRKWSKGFSALFAAAGPVLRNIGRSIMNSLISGITDKIPGLKSTFTWITDHIPDWKGPAGKDATLLVPAGHAIMGGLARGIDDGTPGVYGRLATITNAVRNMFAAVRAAEVAAFDMGATGASAGIFAGTKAPSTPKFKLPDPISGGGGSGGGGGGGGGGGSSDKGKLGEAVQAFYTFPATLKKLGAAAMKSFIAGLSNIDKSKIADTATRLADAVKKAFTGLASKTKIDDGLLSLISATNRKLQGLADTRQKIADKLQEALAFAAQIEGNSQSFASALGLKFLGPDGQEVAPQADTIISGLKGQLAKLRNFGSDIATLVKAKLSPTVLRQLLEGGPEQASAMAMAIAAGGQNTVDEINNVQGQIDVAAKALGEVGADYLYDAGAKAGNGFLTGLKGQLDVLEQTMEDLATRLVNAVNAGIAKAQKVATAAADKAAPKLAEEKQTKTITTTPKATPHLSASRAAVNIENYHEAPGSSAYANAEAFHFLITARG